MLPPSRSSERRKMRGSMESMGGLWGLATRLEFHTRNPKPQTRSSKQLISLDEHFERHLAGRANHDGGDEGDASVYPAETRDENVSARATPASGARTQSP